MTSPMKPWESNSLQNSNQGLKAASAGLPGSQMAGRSAPVLPPLPRNSPMISGSSSTYNSYMPYSSGYNSMGLGSYGSYGSMPYRSSLYNSYGSYGGGYGSTFGGYGAGTYGGYGTTGSYGMYGMGGGGYPGYAPNDDAERRFIQFAEQSSRHTFANVESIVRAFSSISMMLDNTFFAMTSSFRAVLSVAENFGKLRNMFGHIWYSISIFRLFHWLYRKLMAFFGYRVQDASSKSMAWNQAAGKGAIGAPPGATPAGSSWPTLAFLGVLVSAPYIISKFLPKYEDKCDPANWKSPGVRAKVAFDFVARGPTELSVQINDDIILAPTYVQEEMNLKNTGWAFAICNGRSGVIPLNYLLIHKPSRELPPTAAQQGGGGEESIPVPRVFNNNNNNSTHHHHHHKSHTQKRVSFGENQIFENVDLEDYVTGKKEIKGLDSNALCEKLAETLNHRASKGDSLNNVKDSLNLKNGESSEVREGSSSLAKSDSDDVDTSEK